MKRVIMLVLCMISSVMTWGQNQKMLEEIRCTPPKFTGIEKAVPVLLEGRFQTINEYLIKTVKYPESAIHRCDQGTVVVQFMVTATGEIADINVINSVSNDLDMAVTDAIKKTSGMWKPGFNNDKPAAMEKEISMVFRIGDFSGNDFMQMARKYYVQGNLSLFNKQNPKKALRFYDKGVILVPNDRILLAMRGLARFEVGDRNGALTDWNRIKALGGSVSFNSIENLTEIQRFPEGYALMSGILNE